MQRVRVQNRPSQGMIPKIASPHARFSCDPGLTRDLPILAELTNLTDDPLLIPRNLLQAKAVF